MKSITLVKNPKDCSACGACLAACPTRAITMDTDTCGCQYPTIDSTACIQCGKCVDICGYHKLTTGSTPVSAYAAVGEKEELVNKSASGGVFATLAENCLKDGGMIAGAVMDCVDGHAEVYHILTDKISNLCRIQGSKYVQSEAWRCYADVLRELDAEKTVLFSGTPCQVAGIKQLTNNPDNLITVDLICHGVPPLRMLNDYLDILAKRFGGKVQQFFFREKACHKDFCARIDIAGKKKKRSVFLRSHYLSFYKYFLEGSIYRENCYSCPYASRKRVSDITIGDYWGIEQFHGADMAAGELPQRKDWSCVLVNTEKGNRFLDKHGQNLFLYPTDPQWVAKNNQQLNAPSRKGDRREDICKAYAQRGYAAVETDFIRRSGGVLRFYWRMLKNLYQNKKNVS